MLYDIKTMQKISFLFLFFYIILLNSVFAQPESFDYIINEIKIKVNSTSPQPLPSKKKYLLTEKEKALFKQNRQIIESLPVELSLSISDSLISFSDLQPNNPQTKKLKIKVKANYPLKYQVLAGKTSPLRQPSTNLLIPDTSCDKKDCSISTIGKWTKSTTYGFGYNIMGDDIVKIFPSRDYFKAIPSLEKPDILMSGILINNKTAIMTIKVNPPPQFTPGFYETTLRFILVPTL